MRPRGSMPSVSWRAVATILPWEDRSDYQTLLDALVQQHVPDGPTKEHLVEEMAGII